MFAVYKVLIHIRYSTHRRDVIRMVLICSVGFLGKSFTRHLNRFWNYVVKGALGSCLIVLGFAPVCLFASTFSVVAAALSPLW